MYDRERFEREWKKYEKDNKIAGIPVGAKMAAEALWDAAHKPFPEESKPDRDDFLQKGWYWIRWVTELGGMKIGGAMQIAEWSDISKQWLVCGGTEPLNPKGFIVIKRIPNPCNYCSGEGYAVNYLEKPGGRIKLINHNFPCNRCKGTGEDPEQ
jgi:hypothetical protein